MGLARAAQGKPVATLLGGSPGTLRAYASSMRRDITPREEAERLLRLRDTFGFDAFKFRVGRECGHDQDEWPGRTEEIVPAVRRALGPDVALLVDGNSCYCRRARSRSGGCSKPTASPQIDLARMVAASRINEPRRPPMSFVSSPGRVPPPPPVFGPRGQAAAAATLASSAEKEEEEES